MLVPYLIGRLTGKFDKLICTCDSGVNSIAIHPSSKLALTLGQNKTLRTWNLIKGRPAYISNLSR